MLFLKRLSIILLLLVVLLLGALFSVQNGTPVPLDLLAVQLAPRPVALWLLAAFTAGGLAGVAVSMVAIVKLKSGQGRLRRQLGKQAGQSGQVAVDSGLKD